MSITLSATTTTYRNVFLAIGALVLLLTLPSSAAFASCYDAVQGKIAWNYQGDKQWNPANVERLCGDSSTTEPARCFEHVMFGDVNWGGGTRWAWENALNLCAESSDAKRTISCFEAAIDRGESWQKAIPACDEASPKLGCFDAVQGKIAWNYEDDKQWNPTNVERLCDDSPTAEPARCFERVMFGDVNWGGGTRWQWENALALCKGSSDAKRTISCFEAAIARGVSWQKAIPACS